MQTTFRTRMSVLRISSTDQVLGKDSSRRKTVFILRCFRFPVGVKIAVPVHTHVSGKTERIFSSTTRSDRFRDPSSLLFNGYRSSSNPSKVEVTNEWSSNSAPHICLSRYYLLLDTAEPQKQIVHTITLSLKSCNCTNCFACGSHTSLACYTAECPLITRTETQSTMARAVRDRRAMLCGVVWTHLHADAR